MMYWLSYFLIWLIGGGGLLLLLVRLHRAKSARPLLENLTLAVLALFVMLMATEFYFKIFFAQPDALMTLAAQNWYERYYGDSLNSLGYRDIEWTPELVKDKRRVMVVGDSFVEGVGIEYPEDRFSDLLAQKLGPGYAVFNLGKRRANTVQEIEAIVNYPHKPDILVLSYFVNDIDGVRWWYQAENAPSPLTSVSPVLLPLVRNSYAFNFLYWRLARLQANQPDVQWESLLALYNDPGAWWLHQQDLLAIVEGARSEQTPLIVVVFPSMNRPEESKAVAGRVIQLFESNEVPVIDVSVLIEDIPVPERMVSPVDPHPGELVNQRVAEALYEKFIQLELVENLARQ